MIYISEKIFSKVTSKEVHEECGFLVAKNHTIIDIVECKNLSPHINQFQIGLFDKLRLSAKLIKMYTPQFATYHVHNNGLEMSPKDIEHARIGSINGIICRNQLKLFAVVTMNRKKVSVELDYAISE